MDWGDVALVFMFLTIGMVIYLGFSAMELTYSVEDNSKARPVKPDFKPPASGYILHPEDYKVGSD